MTGASTASGESMPAATVPVESPLADGQGWAYALTEAMVVGGATLLLFPLAYVLRITLGFDRSAIVVGALMLNAARVINDPHFSVTYLLFYRSARARAFGAELSRAQRARYVFAGVVVPAVLVTWAGLALYLRSAQSLGWMIELMFLLVGWHYAKQGFGVLTVLSARRGVRFTQSERTVILAHCYAAWAFAWANPSGSSGNFIEKGVRYWGPAHPPSIELVTGSLLLVSSIALIVSLSAKWRRERRLPGVPLTAFLITLWVWTIGSDLDPLVAYAIPALHSIQYLYFVWLMRRNEALGHQGAPTFGPPVTTQLALLSLTAIFLGWVFMRGVPALLDDLLAFDQPGPMGPTPFFAAFAVVINVHHYFMDNVLWRRDNPETRFLRGPDPAHEEVPA